MIPLHLSGAVIAGIFIALAVLAWCFAWILCVIVDEPAKLDEHNAKFSEDLRKEMEGWK